MLESHTIPVRNSYLSANGDKPGHGHKFKSIVAYGITPAALKVSREAGRAR